MPDFILNRNYVLDSLYGHSIRFVKGQPTFVPPTCVKEAVAIGAECCDGPIDVLPADVKETIPMSPAEREEMFVAAFDSLIEKNVTKDFTGAGIPTVKAVERETGFGDVDAKEIATEWQKYRELKAKVE